MSPALRTLLKRNARLRRAVRLRRRRRLAGPPAYFDWTPVLGGADWTAARAAATGPRVLLATSLGAMHSPVNLEALLAVALTLRGADVEFLLCDRALPACMECDASWFPDQRRFVDHGPARDLCRDCHDPAVRALAPLGLPVHGYAEQLTADDRALAEDLARRLTPASVRGFVHDGAPVGEHALAGALRYFARATLDGEPHAAAVLARYVRAAVLTDRATARLLTDGAYERAVFHHGIYVPQGLVGAAARRANVPVVNWNIAYRRNCFIFSHGDTYHHTLRDEPVGAWDDMPWNAARERRVMDYLASRRHGANDWIRFHRGGDDDDRVRRAVPLDPAKPWIGLLTNVMWDAQLHYPANAFPDMRAWLLETIRWFERRPDLQLVVRVHPAEVTSALASRQPVAAEIAAAFPTLPANVHVVPPESPLSTYALMDACDSVLIYGTKTGVELSAQGIPVIVAGEAWIRGKGLTHDASSPDDYRMLLERLPFGQRLDDATVARARRYAYHFFFRRMLRLPFLAPTGDLTHFRIALDDLAALRPGASPALDVICDGILEARPFVHEDPGDLGP